MTDDRAIRKPRDLTAPILLNLRVVALGLAGWWLGLDSVVFWVLAADYVAWLLSYPERGCDVHALRKSDFPGQLYELTPKNQFNFYFGNRRLFKTYRAVGSTINAHGFRGPEIGDKDPEHALRVLVLGDSGTFGEGVKDGEEFIRLIEKHWNREERFRRRIEFINTAVGGYNTTQEVAVLRRYQPVFEPDMVWMFVSVEDTLPWGTVTITDAGSLYRPGAPRWFKLRWRAQKLSGLLWWLFRAYQYVRLDPYIPRLFSANFAGYHEWKKALREYADLVGNSDRSLVFFITAPWKLDDYPWKSVHKKATRDIEACGLRCVDLLPALEGRNWRRLISHPIDLHPNALGHKHFADYIVDHPLVVKQVERRIEELQRSAKAVA